MDMLTVDQLMRGLSGNLPPIASIAHRGSA